MTSIPQSSAAALPYEIQLDICSYLSFEDLQALRQTCRFYKDFLSDNYALNNLSSAEKRFICGRCLWSSPGRYRLMWTSNSGAPNPPLSARCGPCALNDNLLTWRRGVQVVIPSSQEPKLVRKPGPCFCCGQLDCGEYHVRELVGSFRRHSKCMRRSEDSHLMKFITLCLWCKRPDWEGSSHAECMANYARVMHIYYFCLATRSVTELATSSILWGLHTSTAIIIAPTVVCLLRHDGSLGVENHNTN